MVAIQAGTQTAASSVAVDAAVSRAEELKRPIASGGTMFGSVVGRERRRLWAILSFLFVLGFAVSTFMVHAERNGAFDSVAKLARDDAQLLTATLTGKQLTKPVTGSSYDRLAAKIRRSVSSKGSIVGVTVWSSQGQILFSLNESLVGTTPPEMQTLIVGISQGPGGTRVLDDTVQTFMPVSKATGGPVAVVELDQPFAFVEARIGGFWSMLRLGFAFGLAVSLLLLGLTFVSSRSLARAPEDDERQAEGDEGADMGAEGQPEALQPYFDAYFDGAVDQDKDLEGDVDSQESMRQRRDEFKARAKEAELRVKKLEAELHEAPSAPKSEQ